MVVFLNGHFLPEADAVVPLNDRGFLLGDGLFETARVANGKPFRLAQHLERLVRGADVLKIKPPFTAKEIQKFAGELIAKNDLAEAGLRLGLYVSASGIITFKTAEPLRTIFRDVPMDRLLSKEYASERRRLVDARKASMELRPGGKPEISAAAKFPQ